VASVLYAPGLDDHSVVSYIELGGPAKLLPLIQPRFSRGNADDSAVK